MIGTIARFEIRYWMRSFMLWIFTFVIALMIFGATSSDHVTVGGALSNTLRNAPFVILNFYSIMGLLTLLMVTAFVNSAASRDFSYNTYAMLFTTPLKRRDFLLGRFLGSALVSVIPMLGVSIGVLAARYMPWVDPERWGPVVWKAHLQGIVWFAIPNTLIVAAILFTVALLARNDIVAFVAGLGLLVGYGVSAAVLQKIEHEKVASLLDPFAIRTFSLATKYWTVAEKNTLTLSFDGMLLWNRLLWLGVAGVVLAIGYARFSFAERKTKAKAQAANDAAPAAIAAVPEVKITLEEAAWTKFAASVKVHFVGILKSTVFIVILLAALLNCVPAIFMSAREGYGLSTLPVTYWILEIIAGTLYLFVLVIITYYAGVLVWKDRDYRLDEIADSLPVAEWVSYLSRFVALGGVVLVIQALALLSGVAAQLWFGYHRFQFDLYLQQLFVRDTSFFLMYGALAMLFHVISPNKYVGYFAYIAFVILNLFIWRPLNVATYLLQFGQTPDVTYSDFFRDLPYITAWRWFTAYWTIFCVLLAIASILLWPRGKQGGVKERLHNAALRFSGKWRLATAAALVAFVATGGWIYYNTKVLNQMLGPKDMQRRQAEYEKRYKQYETLKQPRLVGAEYQVDLYPETRSMVMRVEETIYNPYDAPLAEVHFTTDRKYDVDAEIPGAKLKTDDKLTGYRIYEFTETLKPGERRTVKFTVKSKTRGFENSVSNAELVQNGTFFNNTAAPILGYTASAEMQDPVERKKFGLGDAKLMPALEKNCTTDCMDTYLEGHSDYVEVKTIISTSPDQIAIAPGSLVREWNENGRRYFEYKLDHPSLAFYSFLSARYEVERKEWNGIKLEVYYLPEHKQNVPRMMKSLEKSLEYYTQNFGPYYHKEARIIEFPRIASFAQAFAGTMPYSESIGFIANLNHPDDIDMVYYVVAHEMGHQWWAHQVVGARMEGATLLSETMAQYSALMVMEKEYGRDMMRKFLKYEMDRYLRARGQERLKERPLLNVEASQGYIHYRKGSVVLYYLKEMIGEEKVNAALRKMVEKYAYAKPPYPTSWELVEAFQEQMPDEYKYLAKDLFEDITLFSNRTMEATAAKRADGKYDVTIDVEAHKFKADEKGNESEVQVDDWIEIGAFAKPEKDKQYGKTLYRERVHVTQAKNRYTFTTDEAPEMAGIDPFLLLIDRMPDDNTKKVTVETSSASGK